MNGSADWRDAKYDETLELEHRGLERRRESDPALKVSDIEGQLKHLYNMQGNDWAGRGELQDIILGATIAAYERFVVEWKLELESGAKPS